MLITIEKSQSDEELEVEEVDQIEHARKWVRAKVATAMMYNSLTDYYISQDQLGRAKYHTDSLIEDLDNLTVIFDGQTKLINELSNRTIEDEYAQGYYRRAMMADRGHRQLNQIEELRLFTKWSDKLLEILEESAEEESRSKYEWNLERRIRFGLHLLDLLNSEVFPKGTEKWPEMGGKKYQKNSAVFKAEMEDITKQIHDTNAKEFVDEFEFLVDQIRSKSASRRLNELFQLLKSEEDHIVEDIDYFEFELDDRIRKLSESVKMLETRIGAFTIGLEASLMHDGLYGVELDEDHLIDEDLSELLGFSLKSLPPEKRRAGAELMAIFIQLLMKFEEDQIDWTVPPFETSTGEKRHPFFGPLIWDLIVTYVALNYQNDYDLLDDEYEIADILAIFSQSEDLQVLCKELNACLEAEEPESKSSAILDHMSCRYLCSVYASFRLNELIDELPKLEE